MILLIILLENLKNIYDIKIKILFDKYGVKKFNKLTKLRDTIGNIIIKKKELNNILKSLKYRLKGQFVTDDNGSIGVSHICSIAKKKTN